MKSNIQGFASEHRHVPRSAIVFYGPEDRVDQTTYAARHEVRLGPKGFELAPGVSLTPRNIKLLAQQANNGRKHEVEILPAHVLVASESLLAWWVPAGKRYMSFDIDMHGDLPGRKRLQGVSAELPVPPLVFAIRRDRSAGGSFEGIYVYALLEDNRPVADTVLYRAPFLNVGHDGDICWGNGEKPRGKSVKDTAAWEAMFFSSVFSHYNGSIPIECADPYDFIADLIATKPDTFPKLALKPARVTLATVIKKLGE